LIYSSLLNYKDNTGQLDWFNVKTQHFKNVIILYTPILVVQFFNIQLVFEFKGQQNLKSRIPDC